jgi:hypothetical protein
MKYVRALEILSIVLFVSVISLGIQFYFLNMSYDKLLNSHEIALRMIHETTLSDKKFSCTLDRLKELLNTPPSIPEPHDFDGIKQIDATHYVVDKEKLYEYVKDPSILYRHIRSVPHMKDGAISGMKILSVRPASIFDQAGFMRGDVVTHVNGEALNLIRGFGQMRDFKDEPVVTFDLERGGKPLSLQYELR